MCSNNKKFFRRADVLIDDNEIIVEYNNHKIIRIKRSGEQICSIVYDFGENKTQATKKAMKVLTYDILGMNLVIYNLKSKTPSVMLHGITKFCNDGRVQFNREDINIDEEKEKEIVDYYFGI